MNIQTYGSSMGFALTVEQEMLRETLRDYLSGSISEPQSISNREEASRRIWSGMAKDLQLPSLSFPLNLGGLGGGAVETMLVMEELGRASVSLPYLETLVIGGRLLRYASEAIASSIAGGVMAGEVHIALAHEEHSSLECLFAVETTAEGDANNGFFISGQKSVVVGFPGADYLAVSARMAGGPCDRDGISLFLIDSKADGISSCNNRTLDGRMASNISFSSVRVPGDHIIGSANCAGPILEEVYDVAAAAMCAEAVGIMERAFKETLDYARARRQGNSVLADHQVVQHKLVDMYIPLKQASALAHLAALKLDASPPERAAAVSASKVYVSEAARRVTQTAIQLHGGMGLTDELVIGHLFRRCVMIENQFGSALYHLARYGSL